ncbi:MAG: hypothetical protein ACOX20_06280 [Limnochordia bacterium]|jgi:hypothetical protein|nr:hypothetical protein [Bacillota bacterium]
MERWTAEQVEYLLSQVAEGEREGIPAKRVFERLENKPEVGGRGAQAIAQKYYNLQRARNIMNQRGDSQSKPTAIRKVTPDMSKHQRSKITADELVGLEYDWEVLEAFEGLPDYIAELNGKIADLERKLEERPKFDFASFVGELVTTAQRLQQSQELERLVLCQRKEIEALRAKLSEYENKLSNIKQEYEDACGWFEVFMNSSSVKQMMSVGDIKRHMKTTLDKWGNVLQIEFEEEEIQDEHQAG